MKKIILIMVLAVITIPLSAQNSIEGILSSIEQNNTTLKAMGDQAQADKLENRTGIFLANPEVEFNRLWGNPGTIGNRNDINVSQSFDIPTITGMKSRQANLRNSLIDLQYKSDRINILLEAKQYCLELIYYNRMKQELALRMEHAQTIAEGYENRLQSGDANLLEYNKVQLNLSTVQGELSRIEVERAALLAELKRLNGGVDVTLDAAQFPGIYLPTDFEGWFTEAAERNPVLEYVRREIEANRHQVSLAKATGLPTFSAGFMREKTLGQNYQGVSLGVSIPLWENKNRVKQARAAVVASETRERDTQVQYYEQLRNLYGRAAGLGASAAEYRRAMSNLNSTDLLKKALDAGEISLLEYIVEIGLYYDTVNKTVEAERDYQLALAQLSAVEL